MSGANAKEGVGLLGDTPARDYARKLQLFNAFAARELRTAIDCLHLRPGMRVLDAGCGAGDILPLLHELVSPQGVVVGMDLAAEHARAARSVADEGALVIQGDVCKSPLPRRYFDAVWCVNTINHLRDPIAGVNALSALLREKGCIAIGQSSFVPDMYFAWDSRLERVVNEAVREYYRDRYRVSERDLTAIRALVGLLQRSGFSDVDARTIMIERVCPLSRNDIEYLREAIFRETFGARLQEYLSQEDYEELSRLCDPAHANYALQRRDFHFLQTFTVVVGRT